MKKHIILGSIGTTLLIALFLWGSWFYSETLQAAPSAKAQIKSGIIGLTNSTVLRVNVVNLGKTEVTGVLKFADGLGKIQSFQCDFHLMPGQSMWMDVKGSDHIIGPERAAYRAIVVVNESELVTNVVPTIEIFHAESSQTIAVYSFR